MKPLTSVAKFEELKERTTRKQAKNEGKILVKVHLGTCGISSGADKTLDAFKKEIATRGLSDVIISQASCLGICDREPTVTVIHPKLGKVIYHSLSEDKVAKVVEQHLRGGGPSTSGP